MTREERIQRNHDQWRAALQEANATISALTDARQTALDLARDRLNYIREQRNADNTVTAVYLVGIIDALEAPIKEAK